MLTESKIKSKFKIVIILILIIATTSIIRFSLSAKLDNDVEVEFNSELTYYLDVTYDGVDKYGIESNDETRANVTSDYIYVEDKLPDGLIFNGFVTTSDKTFGAVSRDDSNSVCYGSVIDDSKEEIETRLVKWLDYYGRIIKTEQVNWGEVLPIEELNPAEPTLQGYTFDRWDGPYIDENLNIVYKAFYKSNTSETLNYIVEWYDIEGEKLRSSETRIGTSGSKISVTESDKVISGYTFDETNPRNILTTTLSSTSNKLRLYFRSPSQMENYSLSKTNTEEDYKYNYHGLHYDEKTRTISFKVRNLQAGCKLTIGIKTITPSTVDDKSTEEIELRRDFYNFSTSTEKNSTKVSNTVHAWMGTDKVALYNVKYEYLGDIPINAPALPSTSSYSSNSNVGIALVPILEGYSFSGWTTEDVNVSNNNFIMPSKDVTFKGSFEKLDNYNVSYEIEGDIPEGYISPSDKSYNAYSFVKLDSLKKGEVFNGYRFLGWKSNDVIINTDQTFIMPEKDVTIVGQFEPVTYKVEYRFYDTILPPNSDTLLPSTKEYRPNSKVSLEYPPEISGYKFLGWYKEDNFEMPDHDVVIYGEWKILNGTFTPSITKEITSKQDYYKPGDIVYYKVTVTNNADYEITNIILEEKNKKAIFYQDVLGCLMDTTTPCLPPYIVKTGRIAEIPKLAPHTSIEVLAKYIVDETDQGTINNEVEITSALASNNYELDTSLEYKATSSFKVQSHLRLCKSINSNDLKVFQFHITDNENYDSWINLSNNECTSIYIKPNSYNVSEIVPQEYILKEVLLTTEDNTEIISNNHQIEIEFGKNYEIIFKNQYKRKGFYHSDGRIVNKVANEPKKIIINVDDYTKEYDGTAFNDFTYRIEGIDEDLINLTFPTAEYKNAGIYYIAPRVSFHNPEDESKYDVIINPGRLVINSKPIIVQSGSSTKKYDGMPLTNSTCEIIYGTILTTDSYVCNVTGYQLTVGESSNTFDLIFDNQVNSSNYSIIKINGTLTITEAGKYKVIYNDGAGGNVFNEQIYYGYNPNDSTPNFEGTPYREGYTFMGWAPAVNPIISSDDANEKYEIIYYATWLEN